MQYSLCRHIKTNGLQCKSPSLTGDDRCYFHSRLHQSHKRFRHDDRTRGYLMHGQHIELFALEDSESVQVALSVVINALATGNLEPRRATALLYGLQLASNNAGKLNSKPYAPNVVRDVDSSPDGLDLAQPGATVEISESYDPKADLALDDEEEEGKDDEEEEEEDFRNNRSSLYLRGSSETEPSGSERESMGMKICEPTSEVELTASQVASSDQAEDSVLQIGMQLREGVPGTGAGDGFEFVETDAIVEGDRRCRRIELGLAGAGGEVGVQAASRIMRPRMGQKQRDGLQGCELGGVQVLRDVKGAAVDETIQP